jgi:hypothetical protein
LFTSFYLSHFDNVEQACVRYGWGRWKEIASFVPSRSRSQVKSHAQKFQLVWPKEKERLDMLHEERKRKKKMFAVGARRKAEMKEFELIALALLNIKHQPTSFEFHE